MLNLDATGVTQLQVSVTTETQLVVGVVVVVFVVDSRRSRIPVSRFQLPAAPCDLRCVPQVEPPKPKVPSERP